MEVINNMKTLSLETKEIKKAIVAQIKSFLDEYLSDNYKQGRKRKNAEIGFFKVRARTNKKGRRKILSKAEAELKIKIL